MKKTIPGYVHMKGYWLIAFVVSLVAIKSFIDYLSKKGFKLFGYYRIVLGIALLIIHFFIYRLTTV